MDRKYTKNNKALAFVKRNIYYIIMLVCLAAIATMVTITLINKSKAPNVEVIAPPPVDQTNNNDDDQTNNNDDDDQTNNNDDNVDNVITPTPVVFACPVEDVVVLRDYVMDNITTHLTLNKFAVSSGILLGGEEGDNVFAAYDGTVESVTYDVYYGNKVVIKHKDDIRTTYYSLKEANVAEGQTVTKGQTIGTMGITATSEYLDGPNVHFSVTDNNAIVSPYEYLDIGDK